MLEPFVARRWVRRAAVAAREPDRAASVAHQGRPERNPNGPRRWRWPFRRTRSEASQDRSRQWTPSATGWRLAGWSSGVRALGERMQACRMCKTPSRTHVLSYCLSADCLERLPGGPIGIESRPWMDRLRKQVEMAREPAERPSGKASASWNWSECARPGRVSLAGKSNGFRAVPQLKRGPGRVPRADAYRCRVRRKDFGLEANKAMDASSLPLRKRAYALFPVNATRVIAAENLPGASPMRR